LIPSTVEIATEPKLEEGEPTQPVREIAKPVEEYRGRYSAQIHPLYEFLVHSALDGKSPDVDIVQQWTYTLLSGMDESAVVDWAERPSARARVRLLVKRTVKLFKIKAEDEESLVEDIVDWFASHIPGEASA
jgi:hypothetical protein